MKPWSGFYFILFLINYCYNRLEKFEAWRFGEDLSRGGKKRK